MKTPKNKNIKHLPNKVHPPVYITLAKWEEVMGSAAMNSQDTSMLEQIFPFPMPEPRFDWIRLSLCFDGKNRVDPLPLFVQKFGEAKSTKVFKMHCWKFANGLYLTKTDTMHSYLLMFQASDELLAVVKQFLDIVRLVLFPNARFKLAQAEIAFDFLFPGRSELEVEDIAIEFDRISTPRKHRAPRTVVEGGLEADR